jgi:serine O-acetyltransferase
METKQASMTLQDYINTEVYGGKNINIVQKMYLKYLCPETNCLYLMRKIMFTRNKYISFFRKRCLYLKYGIAFEDWLVSRRKEGRSIGIGLKISHPNCIIIGKDVSIGNGCHFYHNVTLGRTHSYDIVSEGDESGCFPVIGNNVTIYAGASVIGKVKVADGTIIAAGAVVVKDTEPNGVYAGVPAKLIGKRKDMS